MSAGQTAAQALAAAAGQLRAAGVADPARDARLLLAHAARIDATRVTLIAPEPLETAIAERFAALVTRRAGREPVSHLVGERAFYGRRFQVSGDVLDPRPETEVLIEAALAEPFGHLLDLGVGSGCILVTLLAERDRATGVGVDQSEAACLQAGANAVLHGVATRADIRRSDWFSEVTGAFDLIVSNPPYIRPGDWQGLAPEVRDHEPEMALVGGADGLEAYRRIVAAAGAYLAPGGRLLLEIGPDQAADVCELMAVAGLPGATVIPDLDGRDRVVMARAR